MSTGRHIVGVLLAVVSLVASAPVAGASEAPEVPESAHGEGAVEKGNPHVESRLYVDASQVAAGEKVRVGVLFSTDPDWHIYWRNSGDAGMATTVDWSSEGASFGDLRWPAPHAFEQAGEVYTFGYGGDVMLFSEASVSQEAPGELTVEAKVSYLACKVDCIPGSSKLSRTVPVGEKSKKGAESVSKLFDEAASRVPVPPTDHGIEAEVAFSQDPIRPGDTFRAGVGLDFCPEGPKSCTDWEVVGDVEPYRFIPDATSQISWKTLQVKEHPSTKSGRVLVLEGRANANTPKDDERLSGVIHLSGADDKKVAIAVDATVPRGESGAEVKQLEPAILAVADPSENPAVAGAERAPREASTEGRSKKGAPLGFLEAILFAFLGGMILNLMPCVFPVLALKVTSFAELVHEDRAHKFLHGLSYTAGIVVSMLVLAGLVLGFRAAGTQVGWGFQFQNPVFPAVLSAAVVLFALNLFGVFEVHVQSTKLAKATNETSGLQRSAAEGVLAVVLATPCSAPFLGTAVGFALTGSALMVVAVFTTLGVGLAAPFVALTMMPGWAKVLPDPGPWMEQIKKVLGFALIGAAVWLVWVVGRTTGVDGMAQILVFLAVTGLAAWTFGQAQTSRTTVARVFVGLALLGLVATGYWALQLPDGPAGGVAKETGSANAIGWKPWSDEKVDELLAKGRPVFVDFTADWCITCKVNERTVLSTDQVTDGVERYDVATLKADWTDGDDRIGEKLRQFGKAGVPMYLVYSPKRPDDPAVLPEVLTPATVVDALEKAAVKKASR